MEVKRLILETLSLNGRWELFQAEDTRPIEADVPGCVHLDLLRNGLIDEPFYRDNESRLYWIGETDWLYRKHFIVTDEFLGHERVMLRCKGLDTLATLRLNGHEVGRTNNMYRTWEFEIKALLQAGDNTLEVDFQAPMPYLLQQEAERGVLFAWSIGDHRLNSGAWLRKEPANFGWDWGPQLVTSGIWRDIELVGFDTARLTDVLILQTHHDGGQVELAVQGTVETLGTSPLQAQVAVYFGQSIVAEQTVAIEGQQFKSDLTIDAPRLWWPNGMGEQPLYRVVVSVSAQGVMLDRQEKRIGLRTLVLERKTDEWGESFQFVANGVPFFVKGANWIPADTFEPRLKRADYSRLLWDAVAANMNMLRVWGGGFYEADAFYDLCDELGICVWQDFIFACGTYPTFDADFMANVRAEAADNVRRLRHHAALALWCGNNEIEQGIVKDEWSATSMSWADYHKLFDVLLREVVESLDPQHSYWPASPHSPHGDRNDWKNPAWGDTHLWEVWHGKEPFEWYRTTYHRFISEFGFQSFPEPKTVYDFTLPQDRNIASYVMEYHQRSGIGNQTIIHYLLDWFQMPTGFETTLWLSQILQGMAIKYAVEHWRRQMPRVMGSLYWQFNDCWPAPSWSSMDWRGRWKALHYLARHFYAPLLISGLEDSERSTVEIHLSSDGIPEQTGTVRWFLTNARGELQEAGELDVEITPYRSQKIATLDFSQQMEACTAQDVLLWLEVVVDGQVLTENMVNFARPKHLRLVDPQIEMQIEALSDGSFAVTLSSAQVALWAWLETKREARFSDNFVHLRPNKPVKVSVYPDAAMSETEFKAEIAVKSLFDTYQ